MNAIEQKQSIIKEIIKPAFKQAGFNTTGNNFVRKENGFIKVFSVVNSSWNEKDWVDFSLQIGIFFPIVEHLRNKPIHKSISSSTCQFEINSNQLNNSKRLLRISSDTNIEELREYISNLISNSVIPFFCRYSDIQDCIDLYSKYTSYKCDIKPYIGLTLINQGYIDTGKQLMDNINSNYTESFRKQLIEYQEFLITNKA